MKDEFGDVAFRGITKLENELLVRDFLDSLSTGDIGAILPFLHSEVRLKWGRGPEAVGCRRVLRLWEDIVAKLGAPQFTVVTIASSDHTVLVEQDLAIATSHGHDAHLAAFGAFKIEAFQVVRWHQLCE